MRRVTERVGRLLSDAFLIAMGPRQRAHLTQNVVSATAVPHAKKKNTYGSTGTPIWEVTNASAGKAIKQRPPTRISFRRLATSRSRIVSKVLTPRRLPYGFLTSLK